MRACAAVRVEVRKIVLLQQALRQAWPARDGDPQWAVSAANSRRASCKGMRSASAFFQMSRSFW